MDGAIAPWNKGRAQGQKRPLTPAQVGVVKEVLSNSGRLRDLALFSLALDTLLRASALLALRVKRLKDLETENARRRKAISDLTLDKLILQEAARGNY